MMTSIADINSIYIKIIPFTKDDISSIILIDDVVVEHAT